MHVPLRLAVGEALTNLVWAKVISLSDVKDSGTRMYAAKLDREGAAMYDAATFLSVAMIEFGIAIDGEDSLSMAAHVASEVVKAPGNLVMSVYCTCPDIEDVPYLKRVFEGVQDLLSDKLISRMGVLESFDQWE